MAERREAARKYVGKEIVVLTLRSGTAPVPSTETGADARYERHVFHIVGVLEDEPQGPRIFEQLFSGNQSVLVPLGQARLFRKLNSDPLARLGETLLGDTGYQAAIVRVTDPTQTQSVYEQINKMGLRAISLTQQLSQMKTVFMVIDASLALLGGISLLVAALGISNTLIMSITERTREIGVMKAIGGDDRTIMSIFFCEAGLLGLIGGGLGALCGWGTDRLASMIVNHYIAGAGGQPVAFFSIPLYLWTGAIAFAVGISLLAAAYPAYRAARVDPIKALRHD
jgi:ABC-type antimicrobial peptide transport system permease subunit